MYCIGYYYRIQSNTSLECIGMNKMGSSTIGEMNCC